MANAGTTQCPRTPQDDCERMEETCCRCCGLGIMIRNLLDESSCDQQAQLASQGVCREIFLDCCFDRLELVTSSSLYPAPMTSSSPYPPPVTSTSPHPSPMTSSSPHPLPVASSSPHPPPVTSSSPHPSPMTSSSPHPPPVVSSSAHPPPVVSSSAHPPPVVSSSAHPPPVVSSSAHPSDVISYSAHPPPTVIFPVPGGTVSLDFDDKGCSINDMDKCWYYILLIIVIPAVILISIITVVACIGYIRCKKRKSWKITGGTDQQSNDRIAGRSREPVYENTTSRSRDIAMTQNPTYSISWQQRSQSRGAPIRVVGEELVRGTTTDLNVVPSVASQVELHEYDYITLSDSTTMNRIDHDMSQDPIYEYPQLQCSPSTDQGCEDMAPQDPHVNDIIA